MVYRCERFRRWTGSQNRGPDSQRVGTYLSVPTVMLTPNLFHRTEVHHAYGDLQGPRESMALVR